MNVYDVRVTFPPTDPAGQFRFRRILAETPMSAIAKTMKRLVKRRGGALRTYPRTIRFEVNLVGEIDWRHDEENPQKPQKRVA